MTEMTTGVRPAAGPVAGLPLSSRPHLSSRSAISVRSAVSFRSSLSFRSDVEGLRGLAVLLIVVVGGYAGTGVFLAISGFLITGGLLREFDRTGRVSLLGFASRRLVRLLPTALVVLAATLPAGRYWLGPGLHTASLRSLWLPAVALLWPTALLLLLWLGFRWALPFWVVLGAAVAFPAAGHAVALGAGVLLALAADRLNRVPPPLAAVASASGVVLIVVAALGVPVLAVLGAVLVLAGRGDAWLGFAPLTWLGRLAYPFGLWHWPLLVIAAEAYGPLPGRARFVLVMTALALAVVTYVWVEDPIRRRYARAQP